MENSAEISPKMLGKITQDFVKVCDNLKEASYLIRKNGFTECPVFVVSDEVIPYGRVLVGKGQYENEKIYSASYLEIFVQAELLSEEGASHFKENYKNADEYCCLFWVSKDFTSFIFLPYPEDGEQ